MRATFWQRLRFQVNAKLFSDEINGDRIRWLLAFALMWKLNTKSANFLIEYCLAIRLLTVSSRLNELDRFEAINSFSRWFSIRDSTECTGKRFTASGNHLSETYALHRHSSWLLVIYGLRLNILLWRVLAWEKVMPWTPNWGVCVSKSVLINFIVNNFSEFVVGCLISAKKSKFLGPEWARSVQNIPAKWHLYNYLIWFINTSLCRNFDNAILNFH